MVLVFPIRFMKLLLLLHQHVPFLSKKILHSVPFCRTSHVQFLLGSLALCVALSLTLAHVHFRTVIERMCLCPSYCWDRHSSLRPCYFCFFSSWSSGNNGCSEGVVVVLVEQDVIIIKGSVSSVWKKVVVAESDCGCWNLQNQFHSVGERNLYASSKLLLARRDCKRNTVWRMSICTMLAFFQTSSLWGGDIYTQLNQPTPTTTQMFQRERQKFVLAFLFWRTTPAFNLAILLCCCFFPCSCPRGDNWSSPENHGFLFGIKKKPGMRKPKRHTLVVVMQDGGIHNKSCCRPSVCDW